MRGKGFLALCFAASIFLIGGVPGDLVAGGTGGGGEPGANCPNFPNEKYQYNTLPYTGTITAEWTTYKKDIDPSSPGLERMEEVLISGRVDRVSTSAGDVCYASIGQPIVYQSNRTLGEFAISQPGNLRGHCMELTFWNNVNTQSLFQYFGENCVDDSEFWEVIEVRNMKWETPTKFTADVTLMGLKKK